MEGDVENILPRPTLPPPSPIPHDLAASVPSDLDSRPSAPPHRDSNISQHTVHRYASRDLRTREAQAEIEKWDAWHACAGMSRTEAKRSYIEALIETMKAYASGTQESRELVGELEFVWGQIRSQSGSGSGDGGSRGGGSGGRGPRSEGASGAEEDADNGESPRRSGLKGLGSDVGGRRLVDSEGRRMRMLSPMSPRGGSDIVEGREVGDRDFDDGENAVQDPPAQNNGGGPSASRFAALEAQIRRLSTEIAALREQLSANHLLSSSSYSPYTYQQLSLRWKLWYRMVAWCRWLVWLGVRQVCFGAAVLGLMVLWGRWKGDRRAEEWARRRWKEVSVVLRRWLERGWWVVDVWRLKVMVGAH